MVLLFGFSEFDFASCFCMHANFCCQSSFSIVFRFFFAGPASDESEVSSSVVSAAAASSAESGSKGWVICQSKALRFM